MTIVRPDKSRLLYRDLVWVVLATAQGQRRCPGQVVSTTTHSVTIQLRLGGEITVPRECPHVYRRINGVPYAKD